MAHDYQVGFASCDITPAPGQAFMSGYGVARICKGALSRLSAQALALRDAGGRTALIVAADILGFGATTVARLRRRLHASHGLAPEAIVLAASHTHWGPTSQMRMNYQTGGLNIWYLRDLERKLLAIADEALASLVPAKLSHGMTEMRIGHNRRMPQPDGSIGWGVNVDGSYDTHTPVLHIERTGRAAAEARRIVIVSHACHPTGSGGIDKWWHEYPGVMREQIRKQAGDDTQAMFIMGCGADAKQTYRDTTSGELAFSASPTRARQSGKRLARAAMKLIDAAEAMSPLTGPLHTAAAAGTLTMKPAKSRRELERMAYDGDDALHTTWWARQMLVYPDRRRDYDYEVAAWRFGDALTMLFLPGEVCSPLGPLARSLCRTPAMSLGYCNTTNAYIPTSKIVREGGYEGCDSHMAYFLPGPFTARVDAEFKAIAQRAAR